MNKWHKFLFEQHTFEGSYSPWVKDYIISMETIGGTPDLSSYADTGKVQTVGYGSTYHADGTRVQPGEVTNQKKAMDDLIFGLNEAAIAVNKRVVHDLNKNQFDALVCLVYNLGSGNFGSSSLLKLLNANPNDPKIAEEFLLYIKDKAKNKLAHNLERRKFEAKLYFSPVGTVPPYPMPPKKEPMTPYNPKNPNKQSKIKKPIKESQGVTLGDLAEVRTDFPEADFWLIRVHDEKTVGKPVKEFAPNRIGIKVTATDVLDPNYLRYAMEHLWMKGFFRELATGTTNKVNIKTKDVKSIRMG